MSSRILTLSLAVSLAAPLAGCIQNLEPGQVGAGRRVGDAFPGPIAAVLPPMTDRDGNLYVVTGVPDSTGRPSPGTAYVGASRGGWTAGCQTSDAIKSSARGWIGATSSVGWLWADTAVLELDTAGNCTARLDRDPASASDVTFQAVAPVVEETLSGNFAIAILSTTADPAPHLATIDLGLGTIVSATALADGTQVYGAGVDPSTHEGVFAISDDTGAKLIFVAPHGEISATAPITGTMGPLKGEIVVAGDGSFFAGVIADDAVLVGDRTGARVVAPDFTAVGVQADDSGWPWVVGQSADGAARIAPTAANGLGPSQPWSCASELTSALAAGIVVVDDRIGERTSVTWAAHSALGTNPLVESHTAPVYGVGSRALLVGDGLVDRGGIPYSQLAVLPAGVSFP